MHPTENKLLQTLEHTNLNVYLNFTHLCISKTLAVSNQLLVFFHLPRPLFN